MKIIICDGLVNCPVTPKGNTSGLENAMDEGRTDFLLLVSDTRANWHHCGTSDLSHLLYVPRYLDHDFKSKLSLVDTHLAARSMRQYEKEFVWFLLILLLGYYLNRYHLLPVVISVALTFLWRSLFVLSSLWNNARPCWTRAGPIVRPARAFSTAFGNWDTSVPGTRWWRWEALTHTVVSVMYVNVETWG